MEKKPWDFIIFHHFFSQVMINDFHSLGEEGDVEENTGFMVIPSFANTKEDLELAFKIQPQNRSTWISLALASIQTTNTHQLENFRNVDFLNILCMSL